MQQDVAAAPQAAEDTGVEQQQQDLVEALFAAAEDGDVAALQRLLSQDAPVNARHGPLNHTALHIAACYGQVEAVKVLLAHGASVDVQDTLDSTPLEIAVHSGHKDVVEVLLVAGAAVAGKGPDGPLYWAVAAQNASMVRLLLSRGADPNRRAAHHWWHTTLLATAVARSSQEVVQVLLQAGATGYVHWPDQGYCDAVHAACRRNRPDMARLLLQHTNQHTHTGLRSLLNLCKQQEDWDVAAQLLLQLESEQHSAAEEVGEARNPSALRMALLKGWSSDTAAVDAGHTAAASQEAEVAEQRACVCELLVGYGAAGWV